MDSNSLTAQLAGVERQINDKERQIQIDDDAAQKEQNRLQIDIAAAQKYIDEPETAPGQHDSWQQQVDGFQSQLERETLTMQSTRDAHQADLDVLNKQKQDLLDNISDAEQREKLMRIATTMAPPQE